MASVLDNPVGRLNEYATKHNTRFKDEYEHSGPDHQRTFVCTITLDSMIERGEGKTKKDAKIEAARNMLAQLPIDELPPVRMDSSILSPRGGGSEQLGVTSNPKGMLQELAQKNQLQIPEYLLIEKTGPSHEHSFTIKCTVRDSNGDIIEQVCGNGKSKKNAENDAAAKMAEKIKVILPQMVDGIAPFRPVSKSSSTCIALEDQVDISELVVQIMAKDFEAPQYMIELSEPADPNDDTTVRHLCLAYTRHCNPKSVSSQCRYDVINLPVVAQGVGSTEQESQSEALLNLMSNISMLGF